MLAIIEAAGWPIWPIIAASVIALGIIGERLWSLRAACVTPKGLLEQTAEEYRTRGVSQEMLDRLSNQSVLGRIFAAGLRNEKSSREVVKESIEEAGRAAAHELGRFLSGLGTIASIAPIMGLLGTVIGMIEIFGSQGPTGTTPTQLAHGISVALYNTAFGLIVAIPSMIFYRYFRNKVDSAVVEMEQQAVKLVEIIHGDRR
ncbi:MAG: MotA/TolQ/ExbB proton channel family protein [Betaproteobacteria bacterium]|nr:MotA/TolQ/ExbB proton channel family protein [Betaproteobacteria bacterium]